jgi:hypothetical protein
MIGIEPTWVTPLDPKSSASASFATSAMGRKNRGIMISVQVTRNQGTGNDQITGIQVPGLYISRYAGFDIQYALPYTTR